MTHLWTVIVVRLAPISPNLRCFPVSDNCTTQGKHCIAYNDNYACDVEFDFLPSPLFLLWILFIPMSVTAVSLRLPSVRSDSEALVVVVCLRMDLGCVVVVVRVELASPVVVRTSDLAVNWTELWPALGSGPLHSTQSTLSHCSVSVGYLSWPRCWPPHSPGRQSRGLLHPSLYRPPPSPPV